MHSNVGRKERNKIHNISDGRSTINKTRDRDSWHERENSREIRENYTEKVIFEQRTKGEEGKSHTPSLITCYYHTFLIVLSEMEVKVVSLDF